MPKISSTQESGIERQTLADREKQKLQTSFERGFEDTRTLDTEVLVEKLMEYRSEIEFAAEAAKEKLSGEFDGQAPTSGNYGIDLIHPGYFGYDDWDSLPDPAAAGEADWLDSHTPDNLASGSGENSFGDPLGVGNAAVHLVLGVGSYSPDPVATRVKFELNDQPQAAINTEQAFRNTDLRVKWLDTPMLLRPDDNVSARFYAGSGGTEALYPIGVSFLEARYQRILAPSDMAGTDEANIVVQR